MGTTTRTRCGRLWSAAELLLQQPQRLLRRDRKIPRLTQDLVPPDARPIQSKTTTHEIDAVPYANGRRLAHSTTADEQHCARGDTGAGCRPRGNAVVAYRLLRRSTRPA